MNIELLDRQLLKLAKKIEAEAPIAVTAIEFEPEDEDLTLEEALADLWALAQSESVTIQLEPEEKIWLAV